MNEKEKRIIEIEKEIEETKQKLSQLSHQNKKQSFSFKQIYSNKKIMLLSGFVIIGFIFMGILLSNNKNNEVLKRFDAFYRDIQYDISLPIKMYSDFPMIKNMGKPALDVLYKLKSDFTREINQVNYDMQTMPRMRGSDDAYFSSRRAFVNRRLRLKDRISNFEEAIQIIKKEYPSLRDYKGA